MRMILKISLSKKGKNEVYNTTEKPDFPGELWNFTNLSAIILKLQNNPI
jgi:hypothetical protein